ncbi:tail protein [Vibrio phage K469]
MTTEVHNRMIAGASVNVRDFGAVGDGVTDDTAAIQAARDSAHATGSILYFPVGLFYVSSTVYLGNVYVKADKPAWTDPMYARREDGTNIMSGAANWNYYFNSNAEGRATTWRKHLETVRKGAAIISDVASPIISLVDGEKFHLDGIGVIGNHRLKDQHGIAHPTSIVYKGNGHNFYNVRVTGCGGNGLHLPKGWEVSRMDGCEFNANNGYGVYTGIIRDGSTVIDSATEYLTITNSMAGHNRLGGFYFEHFRKQLSMDNVGGNNNGQYDSPQGSNNYIDPLLGYDRSLPTTRESMVSLVRINDSNNDSVGGRGQCLGLSFKNVWGEAIAKLIHIRARYHTGVVRNVTFKDLNCTRLGKMLSLPSTDPANGCMVYMDVAYLADVNIETNFSQSLYSIDVEKVDSVEDNIRALGWTPVTAKEKSFLKWRYEGSFGAKSIVADTIVASKPAVQVDFTASGTDVTNTTNIIKETHTAYPAQTVLAHVSKWRIYGQHQATNGDRFGIYEMSVFRDNKGKWKSAVVLVGEHPSGNSFSSAPSLSDAGVLSLPTFAYSLARVELMEGQTRIGGVSV